MLPNYIKEGACHVHRLRLHRQGGWHSICDRRRSDRSQRRQLVLGALLNACKTPKQKAPHMYYSKLFKSLQWRLIFYDDENLFNKLRKVQ